MRFERLLRAGLVALASFSGRAAAQRFVSVEGIGPPALTSIPAPPAASPPPCFAGLPACPLPFPPGSMAIGHGAEAVDEATATVYATDGVVDFVSATYPGCVVSPTVPLAAWPPGPCGPIGGGAAPIVGMCDSTVPGAVWVVTVAGLVSLIPVAPGPPLAQGLVPPALTPFVTGITFDSTSGLLWFTGPLLGTVVSATAPAVGSFVCSPLPAGPVFPIPACLSAPYLALTLDTTVPPGPIPALTVSNGIATADVSSGLCTCLVSPPAALTTTDIDFADVPWSYGAGCGCGPPTIGTSGGYPVLGNGGFAITASGVGPGVAVAALFLSFAPAAIPVAPPCTLHLLPPIFFLAPAVPVIPSGTGACPGTAAYPLPVPAGPPALVGQTPHFQWAFLPAPTPAGFEVSDGLEVVVGFP